VWGEVYILCEQDTRALASPKMPVEGRAFQTSNYAHSYDLDHS